MDSLFDDDNATPQRYPRSERDAMRNAIRESFGLLDRTKSQKSFLGRMVTEFLDLGASPSDVRYAAAKSLAKWPDSTPKALLLHWQKFHAPAADKRAPDAAEQLRAAEREQRAEGEIGWWREKFPELLAQAEGMFPTRYHQTVWMRKQRKEGRA